MYPRSGTNLLASAVPGAARGVPLRARWRAAAMVTPYVGLVGGTIILARVNEHYFERFWWLAPAAALGYLVVLTLILSSPANRQGRRRDRSGDLDALKRTLAQSSEISPAGRRGVLNRLLPRLADVRAASGGLSASQNVALREALSALDARADVERELARTQRRWRRAEALFVLGWLADERSIPALRGALRGPDADLAYVAGQSLADFESVVACACLIEALGTGSPPRPLVATLLESSRFKDAGELIAGAVVHPSPQTRSWVAYLLGRRGSSDVARSLALLALDPIAEVRASAAEALAAYPNVVILRRLLADGDWLVRANAAKAVGRAGLIELAEELTRLMRDPAWWVRQSATLALKQLGAAAVQHVRPLLADRDRFARNKAAEVLVEVGYVAEQIAALGGDPRQVDGARRSLVAVARAEARASITATLRCTDAAASRELEMVLSEAAEPAPDLEPLSMVAVYGSTHQQEPT